MSGLALWPSGILEHEPLNDDYAVKMPDKLSRTDFEQGVARQRRIFRSGTSTFSVTWPMTPEQKFIFDGWYEWGISSGQDWFNIPIFTNSDYQLLAARFVKGSLDFSRNGGEWIVKSQLEVVDYPAPSEVDTAAAMLAYDVDLTLEDIVDLFHTVVHVDFPAAFP